MGIFHSHFEVGKLLISCISGRTFLAESGEASKES